MIHFLKHLLGIDTKREPAIGVQVSGNQNVDSSPITKKCDQLETSPDESRTSEHKPEHLYSELVIVDKESSKLVESEGEKEKGSIRDIYKDLPPYEPTLDLRAYQYPTLDLLEGDDEAKQQNDTELERNKHQIISTLKSYGITLQKISVTVGPTFTLYEIVPAAGTAISRIRHLKDDIAFSLAAQSVQIIAPIPSKGTIGIEVLNPKRSVVRLKTLLASERFRHTDISLPIAIGKRMNNEDVIIDLADMPHLLIAGSTGQGKSVCIDSILLSLLYKKHPSQLKLVLIDPKKVELSLYRHIERHFLAKLPGADEAIVTGPRNTVHTLNAVCMEMDNRFDLFKDSGTRTVVEYNQKFIQRQLHPQKGHQYLPFLVVVISEFADFITSFGKQVELPITRLTQLGRAVGIHLIISTQRPSSSVITGTIKANFYGRIAFSVPSGVDSRTIIDKDGAEKLYGAGDMMMSYNGEVVRLQGAFVHTEEVEKVVTNIGKQPGYAQAYMLPEYIDEDSLHTSHFDLDVLDPLFKEAAYLIVQGQVGSSTLIQRRMKLGYNRANRIMDQLESAGIVGPNQGSKAREVLIHTERQLNQYLESLF